MRGVVFQLLEEVAQREHGTQAWGALLELAGRSGLDWPSMEAKGVASLVPPLQDGEWDACSTIRRSGRKALPLLAGLYPHLFARAECTRSFLLSLAGGSVFDASTGSFRWVATDSSFRVIPGPDGDLFLGYRSSQHHCALAEGLIEGAADHFGESVLLVQLKCMGRGDNRCLFQIAIEEN